MVGRSWGKCKRLAPRKGTGTAPLVIAKSCCHGWVAYPSDSKELRLAFDRDLDCIADPLEPALPIHAVRPCGLEAFLADRPADVAFIRQSGFTAEPGAILLLPGQGGVAGAAFGLGTEAGPHVFGALPFGLPVGAWTLVPGDFSAADAALGFCLGAYSFDAFKAPRRPPARLVADGQAESLAAARAAWLVRDLVNTPANHLAPHGLAAVVAQVGAAFGAACETIAGAALERDYPALAAVGAGSERPPAVALLAWRGTGAGDEAPLVSLCGKGVVFDTGGYDLKPSAGMLRMKKDMGGAALMLGLARMIMAADLPIRLELRVGCVENSVSGRAMRPLDVLATRLGLTVEVGNTDAEGRLVLCDLLAQACERSPDILMDAATLTGAARVALGPDLVAMFSNDEGWAARVLEASERCADPMWRLPLWRGYNGWLASSVADLSNVSSKPGAGAIVAALFLQRFVKKDIAWVHFDTYAWNDRATPGRPKGGEAAGLRAAFSGISNYLTLGRRKMPRE